MKRRVKRRTTIQRTTILEELKKTKTHPKAHAIFKMVRKRIPSISFGTVYRNLNLLRGEGQILELACGKYSCHYDGDTSDHSHFFCLKCKKIFDLDAPIGSDLDTKISKHLKVAVEYHRLDFYGYCRGCKA